MVAIYIYKYDHHIHNGYLKKTKMVFYHLYFTSIIRYHEAEKQRHKFSQVFFTQTCFSQRDLMFFQ